MFLLLRRILLALLVCFAALIGVLLLRDAFLTYVWRAPAELEVYESGRTKLFLRPDHRVLLVTYNYGWKLSVGDMTWTGTPGSRWPLGIFHWSDEVPMPGPNWRRSSGNPVFMDMQDNTQPSSSSRQVVTFGDSYLELRGTRFDLAPAAAGVESYCAFVGLFDIEDFAETPC